MTIYGVDVASYQGKPDWSRVYGAGIRFAFSKVTENVGYVNPSWAHNRKGMLALGPGFLPGAYHFLHGGNGAAQARHFLANAGDVSKFAVALDVEASGADASTARAWVREFKKRTGDHPVIGYYPRWYWESTGRPDLSFFDTIWQSHYVNGTGSASGLYANVPSSWWATFGGEPISILQFSSSATVAGISGRVDVNAYKGTLDQLRALALGRKGEDMAKLDADDKKWLTEILVPAVVKAVLTTDLVPAPGSNPGDGFDPAHNVGFDPKANPAWMLASVGKQTIQGLIKVDGKLDQLAATGSGAVNLEQLAEKLAPLIVPLLADGLAERLEN